MSVLGTMTTTDVHHTALYLHGSLILDMYIFKAYVLRLCVCIHILLLYFFSVLNYKSVLKTQNVFLCSSLLCCNKSKVREQTTN